ncbi:MAG: histidine kinase [Bryobacterales bacterium]|nr:histidine kinase [Bryobacterales bacterium]
MGGTGKLKIVLGYAAGVGKTFRMLEEGQQLAASGRDVVIGYFEPHGRAGTIAKTEGLETVPRRAISYRGHEFEEMDTAAILARRPEICLVDEFAHTNVPGSPRAKRWEDVLALLDAGIDVIATMNIQHLESLNDQVCEISGVRVRETVPDWVLQRAGELVLVDLPPGALLNRLDRGVVYAPEKAKLARENFFKEPTLAALRELALRQAAHEVERDAAAVPAEVAADQERILIHVTASPSAAALIRRGRRVADYLRAGCFAVAILPEGARFEEDRAAIGRHLEFARKLRVETRILPPGATADEARALVDFAHRHGITQIFVDKPEPGRFGFLFPRRFVAMEVIRLARDLQVTVVAVRGSNN